MINFLKRKFLPDDGASFVDLESICILLIASFLIEINAKNSKKPAMKIAKVQIWVVLLTIALST
jgi:hypothetical protein